MTAILTRLDLPLTDEKLRDRIGLFLRVNGFGNVEHAARFTAVQRRRQRAITDPWAYTVRICFANIARLSLLYVLTHWVEMGLRVQLDRHYTQYLGPSWHRFPQAYMETSTMVGRLKQEVAERVTWSATPPDHIIAPESPTKFLDCLPLGLLLHMVLCVYNQNPQYILVDARSTQPLHKGQPQRLLNQLRRIRNIVAHNRYITNEAYSTALTDLLHLLAILGLNVPEALREVEQQRAVLLGEITSRLQPPTS